MPPFTFYLHENGDAVPAFEIGYFDDLAAAKAYGERLLAERPRYRFLEITEGEVRVATITRAEAAASSSSAAQTG